SLSVSQLGLANSGDCKVLLDLPQNFSAFFNLWITQLRGRNVECCGTDLKRITVDSLEARFERDCSDAPERSEHQRARRHKTADKMVSQGRLHFTLVRAKRVQRMAPVAFGELVSLVWEFLHKCLPSFAPPFPRRGELFTHAGGCAPPVFEDEK